MTLDPGWKNSDSGLTSPIRNIEIKYGKILYSICGPKCYQFRSFYGVTKVFRILEIYGSSVADLDFSDTNLQPENFRQLQVAYKKSTFRWKNLELNGVRAYGIFFGLSVIQKQMYMVPVPTSQH
jgi:hypothetical protein